MSLALQPKGSQRRLRISLAICLAIGTVVITTPAHTPVYAAGPFRWVALGDSFSSGEGVGNYYGSPINCHRSRDSWPHQADFLISQYVLQYDDLRACSGTTTADFPKGSGDDVRLVTVTLGGNNIDFDLLVAGCLVSVTLCNRMVPSAEAMSKMKSNVETQLQDLAEVRYPHATVVLFGYPNLLPDPPVGWCLAGRLVFGPSVDSLAPVLKALNTKLSEAAAAAGVKFAPMNNAFPETMCDSFKYINGIHFDLHESFHPNAAGQAAMAIVAKNYINALPTPSDTANPKTHLVPGVNDACAWDDIQANLPDRTTVRPSTTLQKGWTLHNCGTSVWSGYSAVKSSGSYGPPSIAVPTTAPGAAASIWMSLTTPATTGRHRSTYRMRAPDGTYFGDPFWVELDVSSGAPPPTGGSSNTAPAAKAVYLCEGTNFTGFCQAFTADSDDLGSQPIGLERASSIRVPSGWKVAIFEFKGFTGQCETFTADDPDLSDNRFGHDGDWTGGLRITKACDESHGTPIPDGAFRAEYFSGQSLSGTPVLTRIEAQVDGDWNGRSPGSNVPADNFSARWLGRHNFDAADYTFAARSDDGIRVWIDDQLVIDSWQTQSATTNIVQRTISAGSHLVKVEYFNAGGQGLASLRWKRNTVPSGVPNVKVCRAPAFAGVCEYFTADDIDLVDNLVGGDTIQSIQVPAGVTVSLFKHRGFESPCETFTSDDSDLVDNLIGPSQVSSLRFGGGCGKTAPPSTDTVQGCAGTFYTGGCLNFSGDGSNLNNTTLFGDNMESIRVPDGTLVSVYENENFQGYCENFTANDPDLWTNRISGNTAHSFRVGIPCPANTNASSTMVGWVCAEKNYLGHCEGYGGVLTPADRTPSSVRVPWGGVFSAFTNADYTGTCENFFRSDPDLSNNTGGDGGLKSWRQGLDCSNQPAPVPPTECDTPIGTFCRATFDNTRLQGFPLTRVNSASIDQTWSNGPDLTSPDDEFSARWRGRFEFASALYNFDITADDGIRIWLDSDLIVDSWSAKSEATYHVERRIDAGYHDVVVEYYDQSGASHVKVTWGTPGYATCVAPLESFCAEYYGNRDFAGIPAAVEANTDLHLTFGTDSPAPAIPADYFAVRYRGLLEFDGGPYSFTAASDEHIRVWVDDALVIDGWEDQESSLLRGTVTPSAGIHPVVIEYVEDDGGTGMVVTRERESMAPCDAPTGSFCVDHVPSTDPGSSPLYTTSTGQASVDLQLSDTESHEGMPADYFSLQYKGRFTFDDSFASVSLAFTGGGARILIDDQVVWDAWAAGSENDRRMIEVVPGEHEVKVQYRNDEGASSLAVGWEWGESFAALSPSRVFDTRPGAADGLVPVVKQKYGGDNVLRVKVTGVGGVPATGVGAVSLNVTVVSPDDAGYVTVYPCGDRPTASSLNFAAGQVVPNAVLAPISASGEVCFYSSANTHLLADINGWFVSAAGFSALPPARVFDTRPGAADGLVPVVKQKYGGDNVLRVKVTGVGGVPVTGVGAVSLNVTVVSPDGAGYVTVFPCGGGQGPAASNLNFTAGQVVPNAVITPVSNAGEICFYSSANTHLLADINGWFVGVPSPWCSAPGPTFVYPVNGQHLGWSGSWLFKVNPVPLATSYLWGFFQNGTLVWENYRDQQMLSGVEFGIHPDTRGVSGVLTKSRFVPGSVEVWVRALLCDTWTDAGVITIVIDP